MIKLKIYKDKIKINNNYILTIPSKEYVRTFSDFTSLPDDYWMETEISCKKLYYSCGDTYFKIRKGTYINLSLCDGFYSSKEPELSCKINDITRVTKGEPDVVYTDSSLNVVLWDEDHFNLYKRGGSYRDNKLIYYIDGNYPLTKNVRNLMSDANGFFSGERDETHPYWTEQDYRWYNFENGHFYLYRRSQLVDLNKRVCPKCGFNHKAKEQCVRFCKDCDAVLKNDEIDRCEGCQKNYVYDFGEHWSKKDPVFEYPDKRKEKLHFGIELEIDDPNDTDMNKDYAMEVLEKYQTIEGLYKPMFYTESDGSLDEGGIETVWNPKTITWFRQNKPMIKDMFNALVKEGYRSHNTSTCGLHIHIDRTYLGESHKLIGAKIALFINRFFDTHFYKLSRRHETDLSWCKKIDITTTDTAETLYHKSNRERYVLVNCIPSNTIEIRMWKGTLNVDSFIASIELTNAIVNFCKRRSINTLQKCSFDEFYNKLNQETKAYCDRRLN